MCLFMMTSSIISWDSGRAEIKVRRGRGKEGEGGGRRGKEGEGDGEEEEEGDIPFPSSFLLR